MQMTNRSRTPSRLQRALLATTVAAASVAVGMGVGIIPAGADASITSGSNPTPADDELVTVSGFAGTAGHDVSVAECNLSVAFPDLAAACNATAPDRFTVAPSDPTFGFWSADVVVDDGFVNTSFGPLPAVPGSTVCAATSGSNGSCAIQAQEYSPGFVPVGVPDSYPLTF